MASSELQSEEWEWVATLVLDGKDGTVAEARWSIYHSDPMKHSKCPTNGPVSPILPAASRIQRELDATGSACHRQTPSLRHGLSLSLISVAMLIDTVLIYL